MTAVAALRQCNAGGSGSFLLLAEDGHRYWCKAINNFQSQRVPVNEQIVARLGHLIGAPVCDPQLVRIPGDSRGMGDSARLRPSARRGMGSRLSCR